jgi:uncharacterized membrane protein YgdD (TMEM256/DUF423 family)
MSEGNKVIEDKAIAVAYGLKSRFAMLCGAVYLCLGIIIGAFAAHALKASLNDYQLGIIQTGVKYQLIHGLALLIIGVLILVCHKFNGLKIKRLYMSSMFIAVGVFCFSFSLYGIAIFDLSSLGIITPIGGLAMIIGWLIFIFGVYRAGK